jgi:hypothetical protein
MLRAFPNDAVVFTATDEFDVGIHYLQLARGERGDVLAFRPHATGARWYRTHIAEHGIVVEPGTSPVDIARIVFATGRPLFVSRTQRDVITAFPSYPFGTFIRVLPPGSPLPTLTEIVAINKDIFGHFDLDYPLPGRDDEFATLVHWRYENVWRHLGDACKASGLARDAADAYAIADQLAPRDAE